MFVLPDPLEFEWDLGNSNKSFIKHNVSNQETEEVFINSPKFIISDNKHSQSEKRHMLWGMTNGNRKLTVIFTLRRRQVRVISSRDMSEKERKTYEEKAEVYSKV